MKRLLFIWSFVLLLSLIFVLPAQASGEFVLDRADILSSQEEQALESLAREISDRYDFGVYIATLDDFRTYSDDDVFSATQQFYSYELLGRGEEKDGVLLLLSMDDRDFCLYTYGKNGNNAFTEGGREAMTECFLDDFRYDDWYEGFEDYLLGCDDYLEQAEAGNPYSYDNMPVDSGDRFSKVAVRVAIVLLLPLAIAAIVIFILKAKMKTVARAVEASRYVSGNLELTHRYDRYTHTTESRVKVNNSSNRGGGLSHHSGGGGSGTSGKF